MAEYRVNLDIYNGPLDLLLYLIRREEVDIYDIPVARITEQYLSYVEMLKEIDPNLAGDFMVLAATLLEIKTRMLLPTVAPEEGDEESFEIDPRTELVRQLLEYKAFKDAASDLRDSAAQQALRFARRPNEPVGDNEPELDLEDVQVWHLLDAFSNLMTAIGQEAAGHEVIYDDTPVELHATDILDRLQREGAVTFHQIFAGRTSRSEIVGLFLALLELTRQQKILASQMDNFREIHIRLNPNPPIEAEPVGQYVAQTPEAVETRGGEPGEYVAESREQTPPQEQHDGVGSETPTARD